VGGSQDAHVHAPHPVLAQAAQFVAVQEAEQLHLHRGGEVADFVQEDGAAVGRLEETDAIAVSTREGPRACPNSSLSMRFSGMAPQLMATSGAAARALHACTSLANTSLPVPVSPKMRAGSRLRAAMRAASRASA